VGVHGETADERQDGCVASHSRNLM
jgi:hypothetical protein